MYKYIIKNLKTQLIKNIYQIYRDIFDNLDKYSKMATRMQMLRSYKSWRRNNPTTHQRTLQMKRCGKKCFLGSKKSFPICNAGSCKRSKGGIMSAYVRAREMTRRARDRTIEKHRAPYYYAIAKKAKTLLKRLFSSSRKTRKVRT